MPHALKLKSHILLDEMGPTFPSIQTHKVRVKKRMRPKENLTFEAGKCSSRAAWLVKIGALSYKDSKNYERENRKMLVTLF